VNRFRKALAFPFDLLLSFASVLEGDFGNALRRFLWARRLAYCGRGVRIDPGVFIHRPQFVRLENSCWIDRNVIIYAGPPAEGRLTSVKTNPRFFGAPGSVKVGANSHIAANCVLSGFGGIEIGKNCTIAAGSAVYSYSHHYRNLSDRSDLTQYSFSSLARLDQQSMVLGAVVVEDFCAVGLHCVLLPGATLLRGAWLAPGSVARGEHAEQSLTLSTPHNHVKSLKDLRIRE
jgi:acetyltransferase-like isoleucine patch superfamily enzyme